MRLSVLTATKLPAHLQVIKKKLGLTLIKFEDATIDLEPFIRMHPFENRQVLMHSIIKHYIDVSFLFIKISQVKKIYEINFFSFLQSKSKLNFFSLLLDIRLDEINFYDRRKN